jgi:molybdopterin/thiamine biosynthesis adenylyltransferase
MTLTFHEELYRTSSGMERLRDARVTVCGAGALGANMVESLARCGLAKLKVIDRDRVEERNLSTQPYQLDDIGGQKAKVLAYAVYRAVGLEVEPIATELTERNVTKLLKDSDLVIDAFDNSLARGAVSKHCREKGVACLHAGLANGYAEVLWNEVYRVPSAAQDDICDYPLARNLVTLTVAIACESAIDALLTGNRRNWTATLGDLSIRPFT